MSFFVYLLKLLSTSWKRNIKLVLTPNGYAFAQTPNRTKKDAIISTDFAAGGLDIYVL